MNDTNPGFPMAVMWYGVSFLPRLRGMSREQLVAVTDQASEVSGHVPIHLHPEEDLRVPLWSDEPVSGGKVTALMVFGLWVLCNEDSTVAAPLLEVWPIKEVIALCDGPGRERKEILLFALLREENLSTDRVCHVLSNSILATINRCTYFVLGY